MLPILSPYFSGQFASYGQGVGLITNTHSHSLHTQMANGILLADIDNFAQQNKLTKPKSQASVWHMHYTLQILPSIIVAHSILQRSLPVSLKDVSWQSAQQQLLLANQGQQHASPSPEDRYHALLFQHLTPLHKWLSEHYAISERVLWSNCAFRINQFFSAIMQVVGKTSSLKHDRNTLLVHQTLQGRVNPLFNKPLIITHSGQSYPIRNQCCLLHEVPHRAYCSDCPKLPEHIAHYSANR
ncbi:ferric iron reductase protein FhuF [Pseudoalteromonas citrea]|uniref:Ferric iron reductase protein FhuF n=2 Tax=Pseudoalteromonas citrea TaxID=43655 RepID=A0AAD4AG44_9GAMM|nr:siderophore-iron reductase FhuF [Pseudoalteromonas citrea]KAF7767609.1 ferric iron reductase protein FhuF [Pseudoalteromonas citrea]